MKLISKLTLALILMAGNAPRAAETRNHFNILDYGAVASWDTKSTDAIRKAIDAASAVGGGTVHIPAGHFLTGPIHLKSNITLFLEAGAHVKFSTNFDDYLPMVPSRFEGVEVMNFSPLIYAKDATNISIRGRGTLDGQGQAWWAYLDEVKKQKSDSEKSRWQREFRKMNPNTAISTTVSGGVPLDFLRPPMIQPYNCTNLLVEGVFITNSPFWTVTPVYCDNVSIQSVTIRNDAHGPNTDGINPDSCRNVRIANCYISVGDDCITIKSGRDEDGRRVGRPAENYTIMNCVMANGHGGVVIGSEMSGGVKNITIASCIFDGTDRGIRLKSTRGRGGVVEDIRVSNIVMRNIRDQAIRINMRYTKTEPEPISERTPVFRNIRINGLTGDAKTAGELIGLEELPLEGISFTDVRLDTQTGFTMTNVKDITFDGVTVNTANGPALKVNHGEALELRGFKTLQAHDKTPIVELNDVKRAYVHGCTAPSGADVFISADASSRSELKLGDNNLDHSTVSIVESK
ncbi:glycoside hydrolase family 28 protein [bacterium]|nr:glycoside hydrolase family 28 protein [bacterium]